MPRQKPTFKSYVENQQNGDGAVKMSIEDEETKASRFYAAIQDGNGDGGSTGQGMASLQPHMIPGETLVTKAHNVVRFPPHSENKHGITGVLFCTNFKVSFVSPGGQEGDKSGRHRNKLIGEQDIALSCIDAVFQVSSSKRKKLQQGAAIAGTVKNLEIHCKDLRIHKFNFKMCAKEEAKMIANAIVHYAFPSGLELLFAFEYKAEPPRLEPKNQHRGVSVPTVRWRQLDEWDAELARLNVLGYKAILCNPAFRLSESLPECFVVPSSLKSADITGACPHFVDYRCPLWCYSHTNGSAIVRMAYLTTETAQVQVEKIMLDAIQESHPIKAPPYVFDLTRDLPSLRDIQASYEKLKELCMPISLKDLREMDSKWYGNLHATRWLQHVMSSLNAAVHVVNQLTVHNKTVVLKEVECRDMAAVVGSLAQILLDPHYRTLSGFQSLIEKEWVLFGHRFVDRLGLVTNPDAVQSPVILLFLDCVWQLMNQFPSAFQFSSLYLTILWDSICLGLFDNFIFNSCRERLMATRRFSIYHTNDTTPNLISVWDWTIQFDRDDMSLFKNPLYLTRTELKADLAKVRFEDSATTKMTSISKGRSTGTPQNDLYARSLSATADQNEKLGADPDEIILHPVSRLPLIKFWSHCYLRWLTPIQIITGGGPLEYLQQCLLVEEIMCLQHKLHSFQNSKPFERSTRKNSELLFSSVNIPQTPRSQRNWSSMVTSSFPYTPTFNAGLITDFGTPLSTFLERSLVLDSDEETTNDDSITQ